MTNGGVEPARGAERPRPPATLELVCDGSPVLVQADDVVVGRTQRCTVRVVHPLVSREHCRFEPRPDGLFVVDLGSINGTWLNGRRLAARTQLRAGDKLGLGREGAILTVQRALVAGVDVSRLAREEDMNTMVAGDARAAGAVARVEIASDALPALGAADEPPTGALAERAAPVVEAPPAPYVPPPAPPLATPASPPVAAPATASTGFASGLFAGLLFGLGLALALARFTDLFAPLRGIARDLR